MITAAAAEPIRRYWLGIQLYNSDHGAHRLEQVVFKNGGSQSHSGVARAANLSFRGTNRVNLESVSLESSGGAGVAISATTAVQSYTNLTFSGVSPNVIGDLAHWTTACP